MSLRSRLLLVVLGLVVVGLAVTDVVTYRALSSFLLHRVDQQLAAAYDPVSNQFNPRFRDRPAGVSDATIPAGSWAFVVDPSGHVVTQARFLYTGQTGEAPEPDIDGANFSSNEAFTVGSRSGSSRFRVLAAGFGGNRLVIAVPLHDVTQTQHRLLGIEALATALVVLVVGGVALVLVRAGLRPLEEFGEVAGAIAQGDLGRRVPVAGERTEVGRLGLSLNAMLGQIQSAFEARQESEDRLRRFVADASHELRTPLTSIRGYAELFRRGAAERPDDLAKAMRRIEEESGRMGVLVDDLLLLARLDQGRPLEREPVDLVRVATDAVDDARAASPDRAIAIDAPARLVVSGDDARLRQVAANLLANASSHTPAGTPVEVRVGTDGHDAVLEVADHGPGLPPEAAERVFERFYRADPSRARGGQGAATPKARGGSGLGLSIVAAIAAAHGGRASVESTPGAGACFRVTIPRAAAAAAGPGADEQAADDPTTAVPVTGPATDQRGLGAAPPDPGGSPWSRPAAAAATTPSSDPPSSGHPPAP
ncbi:MAG: sensor histidine kinase [Acidimicrobiales bacterium]